MLQRYKIYWEISRIRCLCVSVNIPETVYFFRGIKWLGGCVEISGASNVPSACQLIALYAPYISVGHFHNGLVLWPGRFCHNLKEALKQAHNSGPPLQCNLCRNTCLLTCLWANLRENTVIYLFFLLFLFEFFDLRRPFEWYIYYSVPFRRFISLFRMQVILAN